MIFMNNWINARLALTERTLLNDDYFKNSSPMLLFLCVRTFRWAAIAAILHWKINTTRRAAAAAAATAFNTVCFNSLWYFFVYCTKLLKIRTIQIHVEYSFDDCVQNERTNEQIEPNSVSSIGNSRSKSIRKKKMKWIKYP